MIMFELVDNNEFFIQGQDRLHRIGQQNDVNYYLFIARDSIEEVIYKSLINKTDILMDLKAYIKEVRG